GLGAGLLKEDWLVKDGHIRLPVKPGLGFEIDEQEIQKQAIYREELGGEYYYETDGSVADW
ncbi:MAG: galactonate dehydratase, partial [Candidatus Latescibacteria bacterium]|nr:galactonate dehydratase [Candidatus Latescibacterota bacterium]